MVAVTGPNCFNCRTDYWDANYQARLQGGELHSE
jgi:hypothetical protein